MDLWEWLPSHQHALEAHGEFAVNFCPSPDVVMREAAEAFRVLEGSAAGEPTGLLGTFGCLCEKHDVIPPEVIVQKALRRFQPGFRWEQGLTAHLGEEDLRLLAERGGCCSRRVRLDAVVHGDRHHSSPTRRPNPGHAGSTDGERT